MRRIFLGSIVLTLLLNTLTAVAAMDPLFSSGVEGADTAGILSIANSGTSKRATKTNIIFYTSGTTCGTPACSYVNTNGGGFTFSPNTLVNVSATGIYENIAFSSGPSCPPNVSDIKSVLVEPLDSTGSAIFTAPVGGCFVVTCSSVTSQCSGTSVKTVTLTS